jgi:hypothetical protein
MAFFQLIINILIGSDWEKIRAFIQSFIPIIVLLAGFYVYFQSRKSFPKIIQKHSITHDFLDEDILWIRITLEITNQGQVGINLKEVDANLQIIKPILSHTRKQIQEFKDKQQSEVNWPTMQIKNIDLNEIHKQIEPGELDYIFFDFILEKTEQFDYTSVSRILITTNLTRELFIFTKIFHKIRGKDIVYRLSTTYKIESNQEMN